LPDKAVTLLTQLTQKTDTSEAGERMKDEGRIPDHAQLPVMPTGYIMMG